MLNLRSYQYSLPFAQKLVSLQRTIHMMDDLKLLGIDGGRISHHHAPSVVIRNPAYALNGQKRNFQMRQKARQAALRGFADSRGGGVHEARTAAF